MEVMDYGEELREMLESSSSEFDEEYAKRRAEEVNPCGCRYYCLECLGMSERDFM